MDCSPPGSSVPEIFQTRILERVAISSSRGSSPPAGIEIASPVSPALADGFFTTVLPGKWEGAETQLTSALQAVTLFLSPHLPEEVSIFFFRRAIFWHSQSCTGLAKPWTTHGKVPI